MQADRTRILSSVSRSLLFTILPPAVAISFAMLIPRSAAAQYRFDSWTTDTGLPQNTVFAILQTRDGYLWFTTSDGLVRYDGVKFTIFDKGNTNGIRSNRFTSIYEDTDGALWIGTEDGFVTTFKNGTFVTFAASCPWSQKTVDQIRRDTDGTLWVSTNGGLLRWENGTLAPFVPEGLNVDHVRAYPGASGALWCFLDDEVRRFHTGLVTSYRTPLIASGITGVYEDRDQSLLLGVVGGEVLRFSNGEVTTLSGWDKPKAPLARSFYRDRSDALFLGSDRAALFHFENGTVRRITAADGLTADSILTVYEDREGSIWLGTATKGISRMTKKAITVYSSKEGLSGESVQVMLQDRVGDIWVGANGLNRLHDG